MIRNTLLAVTTLFTLAGCEVPVMIAANQNQGNMTGMFEITFPALMLVQRSDGIEEVLRGNLVGHVNGSAKYDITGPTSGRCTGAYTKDAESTLTCENGFSYSSNTRHQRAKMSGVNIETGTHRGTDFIGALGWGNDANEAAVRRAIKEYKLTQG